MPAALTAAQVLENLSWAKCDAQIESTPHHEEAAMQLNRLHQSTSKWKKADPRHTQLVDGVSVSQARILIGAKMREAVACGRADRYSQKEGKRPDVPRRLCKKTTTPISARQQRADAAAAQNWRRRQDRRKARLAAQYSQRNAKRMLTHQGLLRRALQTSAVEVLRRVCKKTTPPAPVPQTLRAILQRSGNLPRPSEGSACGKCSFCNGQLANLIKTNAKLDFSMTMTMPDKKTTVEAPEMNCGIPVYTNPNKLAQYTQLPALEDLIDF